MNEFRKYASGQPCFEQYSQEVAIRFAPPFLQFLERSIEIVQKTTDLETFFHRYGYALFLATELVKMEQVIPLPGKPASERRQELFDKKQEYLQGMISRYCEKTDRRMAKLKTGNTVDSNIFRLQVELGVYATEMSKDTMMHMQNEIEQLHRKYKEKFGNL